MTTYSETFAQWFTDLRYDELPEDVVESTKLRMLDVVGLVLAACPTPLGRSAREAALAMGGGTGSRLLGFGDRATPMCAALANGTLSQALEYDDTHNETIIHASSPNVAAALALGEAVGCSGREVMAVIAGAIELTVRIGVAAPGQFHKVGFHPSGIMGTFGAAYAASRLLGLDIDRMRNAIGIAGSQASGILACWEDGTQSKFLHPGWSALSGIAAAFLGQAGCTGPAPVFESRFGLFASHVQDPAYTPDWRRIITGLGETWESRNISFKPYPAAHVIHAFIDALLHLYRNAGVRAANVERIECPIAEYMIPVVCEPVAEKVAPATDSHGRVSLQYSLAEALYQGRLGVDGYSPASLREPNILALARKVTYRIDPTAPGREHYKGWVIVHLKGGRTVEHIEPYNRGSAENPMSAEDIRAKFRENAARMLKPGQVEAIIERIDTLEQARSLQPLLELCVARER